MPVEFLGVDELVGLVKQACPPRAIWPSSGGSREECLTHWMNCPCLTLEGVDVISEQLVFVIFSLPGTVGRILTSEPEDESQTEK